MKEITYRKSKELRLKVFQESSGFTVMRKAPIVRIRKAHGKLYPQFFHEKIEIAYSRMLEWANKMNISLVN